MKVVVWGDEDESYDSGSEDKRGNCSNGKKSLLKFKSCNL